MSRFFDKLKQSLGDRAASRGRDDPARLAAEVVRLYDAGRYRDAEAAARRLVALQRDTLGEQHPDYATAQSNLGLLLWKLGEVKAAEPLLRSALDLRRAALGESHPQYAASLGHLGELLQALGDLDGAEPLLRRALEVLETSVGPSHPDYATGLTSLALLLQRRGRLDEAEPLLRQALDTRQAVLGDRHPQYATSLGNLGLVLHQRGDLASAEPALRQALDVRRAVLGEGHPDVGTSLGHLARLLASAGRVSEAEPLLARAVEVRRASLGETHPDVAADVNALDSLRRALRPAAPATSPPQPAPAPAPSPVPPPEAPASPPRVEATAPLSPKLTTPDAAAANVDTRALIDEIRKVGESFERISAWMTDEAGRMRTQGRPADPRLSQELSGCERSFHAVRASLARRFEIAGPALGLAAPTLDDRTGLPGLLELAEQLARAEDAKGHFDSARSQATARLELARGFRHRNPAESGIVQPLLDDAEALLRHVAGAHASTGLHADALRVAEGTHPVVSLLRLAEDEAALPDDDWAKLYRAVANAYGGTLAAAAARKRLTTDSAPPSNPAPPRPTPTAPLAPQPRPSPDSSTAARPGPITPNGGSAERLGLMSHVLTDAALGDVDIPKSRTTRVALRPEPGG